MNSKFKLWIKAILPSLLAVLVALIIGGIIIAIKGVNPLNAYGSMLKASLYQTSTRAPFGGLAKTLVYATPLMLASMGVMIAFKAGMFNIGVQGQMIAGGLGATIVGIYFSSHLSNVYLAIFVAMLFGFVWAGIAGLLKSLFSINEVISTIMLNYIMLSLQNYLLAGPIKDAGSSNVQTIAVNESVRLKTLFQEITRQKVNIGLIIAIFVCVAFYFFFKYTTLGYKIKAVGFNPTSSENAGINIRWIQFISMGIAGAVSGLAGAERVLGGSANYVYTDQIMGDFGFTAIAVSLLGANNPFGIIVASIFYAGLEIGGQNLQIEYRLDKEIVYIIQALIIILVAGENIFKYLMNRRKGK